MTWEENKELPFWIGYNMEENDVYARSLRDQAKSLSSSVLSILLVHSFFLKKQVFLSESLYCREGFVFFSSD